MDNLIIEEKLSEADMEAEATSVRLSSDDVFGRAKMTFSELWQSISEEDNNLKLLILSSLLSADNNTNDSQRFENIRCLEELKLVLKDSVQEQDLYNYCCKSIKILEQEMEK